MIYMFIANGFEEIEALCPLDLMRRAGLEVKTVGIGGRSISGAHGIAVLTDISDEEYACIEDKRAKMIFLPGGMPGTLNLAASEVVRSAIDLAYSSGSYIAAICAAPSILGDMGLLSGVSATCYPGFESHLTDALISSSTLVLDGRFLTAAGMGVALEMGLKIVELFCGVDKAEELRTSVIASKYKA